MFVPFDRLYDFLDQQTHDDTIIYRFHPHGSRKYSDIKLLHGHYQICNSWKAYQLSIPMIMHDQEPLNFDLYQNLDTSEILEYLRNNKPVEWNEWPKFGLLDHVVKSHQNNNLNIFHGRQVADKWLLCHSEIASPELEKYEAIDAVGVYWWSHAMIARDWYRYATLDKRLRYEKFDFVKDFNVYNRAWTGSREYRLKFAEMILQNNLLPCTSITLSTYDTGIHYRDHVFQNPKLAVDSDLSGLAQNSSTACASADYSQDDYLLSAIDVVLETLFDDKRIHLTEKILRPIACGKPFILVSTPGCLKYLKNYGFETFDQYIDESYDTIQDPLDRLQHIVKLMKNISGLSKSKKNILYQQLHKVAHNNKKLFWSDAFGEKILHEFMDNYAKSYEVCKSSLQGQKWLRRRRELCSLSADYKQWTCSDTEQRSRRDVVKIMAQIKKLSI